MTLRLKHIASISKGRTTAGFSNNIELGVPLINMSALRSKEDVSWVEDTPSDCKKGDILVCWDGSNSGEFFVSSHTGALASTIGLIKTSPSVDKSYIFYLLKSKEPHLRANIVGMGIPHVNPNELKNIEVPKFYLPTQKKIAAFLDKETARIDELIAKKERLIDQLNSRLQLSAWHLTTTGLSGSKSAATGIEWNPIAPAHWQVLRMANVFSESTETGGDDLPILSVSINWGISDRELGDEDRHRIVNHIEDRSAYKRVRTGDLVYNMMRAWQGAFGVAKVDGLVSPAYVVARPKTDVHAQYFEHLLRTPPSIEEFRRASKGIADFRQRLYWEHFRQVRLALPPLDEQKLIALRLDAENAKVKPVVEKTRASITRLHEYRAALITAAVTGQIDVDTYGKAGATSIKLDRIEEEALS